MLILFSTVNIVVVNIAMCIYYVLVCLDSVGLPWNTWLKYILYNPYWYGACVQGNLWSKDDCLGCPSGWHARTCPALCINDALALFIHVVNVLRMLSVAMRTPKGLSYCLQSLTSFTENKIFIWHLTKTNHLYVNWLYY